MSDGVIRVGRDIDLRGLDPVAEGDIVRLLQRVASRRLLQYRERLPQRFK
jgi:hypothetical protein